MSGHETDQKVPAHAARLLAPHESVRYLTRPRIFPLYMLVFMAAVVLGVAAFSAVIKDPGFMRLLSIPAIPLLGGLVGYIVNSPVILVTDRRVVSAGRFSKPLVLGLERLEAVRVRQNPPGRLLGYGTLFLLVRPLEDLGQGVFLQFRLEKLCDAASLGSAISAAARALRTSVTKEGEVPPGL